MPIDPGCLRAAPYVRTARASTHPQRSSSERRHPVGSVSGHSPAVKGSLRRCAPLTASAEAWIPPLWDAARGPDEHPVSAHYRQGLCPEQRERVLAQKEAIHEPWAIGLQFVQGPRRREHWCQVLVKEFSQPLASIVLTYPAVRREHSVELGGIGDEFGQTRPYVTSVLWRLGGLSDSLQPERDVDVPLSTPLRALKVDDCQRFRLVAIERRALALEAVVPPHSRNADTTPSTGTTARYRRFDRSRSAAIARPRDRFRRPTRGR